MTTAGGAQQYAKGDRTEGVGGCCTCWVAEPRGWPVLEPRSTTTCTLISPPTVTHQASLSTTPQHAPNAGPAPFSLPCRFGFRGLGCRGLGFSLV